MGFILKLFLLLGGAVGTKKKKKFFESVGGGGSGVRHKAAKLRWLSALSGKVQKRAASPESPQSAQRKRRHKTHIQPTTHATNIHLRRRGDWALAGVHADSTKRPTLADRQPPREASIAARRRSLCLRDF